MLSYLLNLFLQKLGMNVVLLCVINNLCVLFVLIEGIFTSSPVLLVKGSKTHIIQYL